MKKLSIVAMSLMMMAGVAYASSLCVPWFVDNAPDDAAYPPASGTSGYVYLKNNTPDDITAEITYVNSTGDILGPFFPDNTFVVPKYSTVAFRPVANALGYQESEVGAAVPDRPRSPDASTPIPGSIAADGSGEVIDTKKNGSITVSWVGGPSDIQGMALTVGGTNGGLSYAHLIPPGT